MHGQLSRLYNDSLALLTDLYQLTMAYGYWKERMAERQAVFHLAFRSAPFGGEYAVACGLPLVLEFLTRLQFADEDLQYLATLEGRDGRPLFEDGFLRYLGEMRFACDVDAVPEGTVVFPHEPLYRVRGPILQAQLLETPLLTMTNFPVLVATKASRIVAEASGDAVLEFGLRRAQGIDGGVTASRASYVGGATGTSNVLAGKLFGIPIKGTHAHSWVMAYGDEREAFERYAEAMPGNCIFLVDTYDSIDGVRNAIAVGNRLRQQGHEMIGIRLDSGDLTELSQAARGMLDEAGFPEAAIVASNDLDDHLIRDLKTQGARVNVWGVGTCLATAYEQAALGGVYKLAAIQDERGHWQNRVKLSEQLIKVSNPGQQRVRRFVRDGRFIGDIIYDETLGLSDPPRMVRADGTICTMKSHTESHDLLVPMFRGGDQVYDAPDIHQSRHRTLEQLGQVDPATRRIYNPTPYPAGLDTQLHDLKQRLVREARGNGEIP